MVRQRLGDFAHDFVCDLFVHLVTQLTQSVRRCDQNDLVEFALMRLFVQDIRQLAGKAVLGQLVPVGCLLYTSDAADE